MQTLQIEILRAPLDAALAAARIHTFRSTKMLKSASPFDTKTIHEWLITRPLNSGIYKLDRIKLFHRLSYQVPDLREVWSNTTRTSLEESKIIDAVPFGLFARSVLNESSFKALIVGLERLVVASPAGLRKCIVRTTGIDTSQSVIYPSHEQIPDALKEIIAVARNWLERDPLLCAMLIWTMLLTIHPFQDANGRISRIVYNGLIRDCISRNMFLPLYELGRISRRGLLLSMREASYFNEWQALSQFIENAISQMMTLQTSSLIPRYQI